MFSFATLPTFSSLRNPYKGNWFIQALSSSLDKYGDTIPLSQILRNIRIRLIHKTQMMRKPSGQMSFDMNILTYDVVFTSSLKRLVSQASCGTVSMWNVQTGICEYELRNQWLVTAIGTSGGRFATQSCDNLIRIWNAYTGECVQTLVGHSGLITYICSLENKLLSGAIDGTIRIWNVNTGNFSSL